MKKVVVFNSNDEQLVKEIRNFQKMQNLPSFIEAVRVLCSNALNLGNVIETYKRPR